MWVNAIGNGVGANTFTQPTVTYNGVGMTFVTSLLSNTSVGVQWVFRLVAPASGANNVVVTQSGTPAQFLASYAISYTGVHQTAPVDQTATDASGTTLTGTATTTVSNDWGVLFAESQADITVGTGTTTRIDSTGPDNYVGDSNGPLNIGSNSMTVTQGTDTGGAIVIYFSPSAGGSSARRTLLGVGF